MYFRYFVKLINLIRLKFLHFGIPYSGALVPCRRVKLKPRDTLNLSFTVSCLERETVGTYSVF